MAMMTVTRTRIICSMLYCTNNLWEQTFASGITGSYCLAAALAVQGATAAVPSLPFRAEPCKVLFDNFEVGQHYQQLVQLRNLTSLGQHIRFALLLVQMRVSLLLSVGSYDCSVCCKANDSSCKSSECHVHQLPTCVRMCASSCIRSVARCDVLDYLPHLSRQAPTPQTLTRQHSPSM